MDYFTDNMNVIILVCCRDDLDLITWNVFEVLDILLKDLHFLIIMFLLEFLDHIDRIVFINCLIYNFDLFFAAHDFFKWFEQRNVLVALAKWTKNERARQQNC